jgi:predicted dehydrogenase
MPIRVAVIGSGFGSSVQIPGFQKLDDVQVVALTSGRLERARDVAARFGIPRAFDDYRAMLDQVEVDLVSVVTPPYLHRDMVLEAVHRGVHVLCEKPFAMNAAEAEEMLSAAEQAGVVHAVDHEFRFWPARAALKQLVDQGYLGEPRIVRLTSRSDVRSTAEKAPFDWWSERSRGGGVLGAVGSHWIDTVRWCFGEPHDVTGALDAFVRERRAADGTVQTVTSDDTASVMMRLGPGGVQTSLSVTMAVGPRGSRLEAFGTDGALVMEDDARVQGAKVGEPLAELPLEAPRFTAEPGQPPLIVPFTDLASRIVAAIRGDGHRDFPTFADGVAVQRALDAVYSQSHV